MNDNEPIDTFDYGPVSLVEHNDKFDHEMNTSKRKRSEQHQDLSMLDMVNEYSVYNDYKLEATSMEPEPKKKKAKMKETKKSKKGFVQWQTWFNQLQNGQQKTWRENKADSWNYFTPVAGEVYQCTLCEETKCK